MPPWLYPFVLLVFENYCPFPFKETTPLPPKKRRQEKLSPQN